MSEVNAEAAQPNTEAASDEKVQSPAPAEPKAEEGKPEEAKPTASAPEEINYDLKVPDGSAMSQDDLAGIAAFAKQHKMTAAQAQELVARDAQAAKLHQERTQAQFKTQVDAWAEEIRNDKDIGGEKFEQSAQVAKRFIDRFGTPELKSALEESGLGNHPALFKLCLEAGKAMQDDKMIFAGSQSSDEYESPASILYGKNHK